MLEATRRALRRRDLHVAQSLRFADPARGLLAGAAWEAAKPAVLRALGRSEDARAEVTVLAAHLDAAYRRAVANLPGNPDLRFEGGAPVLSRLDRLEEPDSLIGLRAAIAARLPKADLPDVVLEIMARTGFAAAFTHPDSRPARVEGFEVSLAAVLLGPRPATSASSP